MHIVLSSNTMVDVIREPTECPLCRKDDAFVVEKMVSGHDAKRIDCPRCGRFVVDSFNAPLITRALAGRLHLLSYVTRAANDRGKELFIADLETADTLASTAPRWQSFEDGVGRLLISLTARVRRFTEQIDLRPGIDYVRVPAKDESQYTDLWQLAGEMGLVNTNTRRITPDGWRRIESLKTLLGSLRQAFVAMWFDPELTPAWTDGFKPGIEASNYFTALRIDYKEFNNKVDDEIVAEIRRSGLVVADFSGHRGGVYFEAGFAMGIGIPVIFTCRSSDIATAHFDTRQYNHIVWEDPGDLAGKLDKRIRATVLPVGISAYA